MRVGAILDRQSAIQKLVGLQVEAADVAMRVVVLGKEPGRAQDHAGELVLQMMHAAQAFRRKLGDAVNVARLQRTGAFVEKHRRAARLVANGLRDHQRGRRGEDEAGAGRRGRLEQVERSRDVGVDESLGGKARDVRLVQRARMHHRIDGEVAENLFDQRTVGDRADDIGSRRRRRCRDRRRCDPSRADAARGTGRASPPRRSAAPACVRAPRRASSPPEPTSADCEAASRRLPLQSRRRRPFPA